jgi:inner membrane protein
MPNQAAAVAVAAGFLGAAFPAALLLFAVLTIVSTLLARRYLPAGIAARGGDINDNVGRLVGHRGAAAQAFVGAKGRVLVDGKEWAAELLEAETLEAGAAVVVTGVEGARLKVRRA